MYTVYYPIDPNHAASTPLPSCAGGGEFIYPPTPLITPLDDVNHRLAWFNTHSLVIKIIQNQYNTPIKGCYDVWRAASSSSRFQIRCNSRRFKSASWFVGFTLEEQSHIPHFCGICACSLLRGGVAEVWNLVEFATTACGPSSVLGLFTSLEDKLIEHRRAALTYKARATLNKQCHDAKMHVYNMMWTSM